MLMGNKLISFDLYADFGCLKKPDINDGLMLTFNVLHKPALLGILGAIVGLRGYEQRGVLPAYYQNLKDLRIGIEPIGHDKGSFTKTNIKYNNAVGYANANTILNVHEQTLIAPAYRCYLLLDTNREWHQQLYQRIRDSEAVFLPYIGKNECAAWFGHNDTGGVMKEYDFEKFESKQPFKVSSIFVKSYPLLDNKQDPEINFELNRIDFNASFMYFERLPIRFNEKFMQYELAEFAFTDFYHKASVQLEDTWRIIDKEDNTEKNIQLI